MYGSAYSWADVFAAGRLKRRTGLAIGIRGESPRSFNDGIRIAAACGCNEGPRYIYACEVGLEELRCAVRSCCGGGSAARETGAAASCVVGDFTLRCDAVHATCTAVYVGITNCATLLSVGRRSAGKE